MFINMQGGRCAEGPWPQADDCERTCLERHHPAIGGGAEDVAGGLIPWDLGKEPVHRLSVWRLDCPRSGALMVALTQCQADGELPAGSALEVESCDGLPYVVALLSTDSGPEAHGPGRVQQARRLLVLLRDPLVRLFFRPAQEGRFHPAGSDAAESAERASSVRLQKRADGGFGHPWKNLGSLAGFAAREDLAPNATGLIQAGRPLGELGVRLRVYHRKLGGTMVYQAFVVEPGTGGARAGVHEGDLLRAVCNRRDTKAMLGFENPAVAVYLLGPGSAVEETARRCITTSECLEGTLGAPGAIACFARGAHLHPPFAEGRAPARLCVKHDRQMRGLTPTHGAPWRLVPEGPPFRPGLRGSLSGRRAPRRPPCCGTLSSSRSVP